MARPRPHRPEVELTAWAAAVAHLHALGLPAAVPEFPFAWLRRRGVHPDWVADPLHYADAEVLEGWPGDDPGAALDWAHRRAARRDGPRMPEGGPLGTALATQTSRSADARCTNERFYS